MLLRLGNQLRKKNKFKYYPIVDKEFIEHNFENFAQRYIKIKHSPDFCTENILKQFRQTLLDHEYKMSIENSGYAIGSGLYIDEMTDDDWDYIETLKSKDREEAHTESKKLTWKQVAEGSIDSSKSFNEQPISDETKIILFGLFSKFVADEKQKKKINTYLHEYNAKIECLVKIDNDSGQVL